MLSARELVLILRVQSTGANDLRRMAGELTALQKAGNKLHTTARAMQSVGTTAQLAGGIATAAFGFAAHSAAEFNKEATLVATQTGHNFRDIRKNTKFMEDGILSLMRTFPAAKEEMTASAYDIYSSLDVNLKGGMRLLKLFNEASVAGMTDLSTATNAGITVMNDFGGSIKDMAARENEMFAAVRFGRMSFDELSKSMNVLVPAAKQTGQSFDAMITSMAFVTRRMPNTSMAATALSRAFELLNRQKFVDSMKKAGVDITNARGQLLDIETVIQRILDKYPKLAKGNIQNFMKDMAGTEGTVQGRRALTFLFHDFEKFQKLRNQIQGDNVEFSRSFRAMAETPAVQWATFVNRMKAAGIVIGQNAIPAFAAVGKYVEEAVGWFESLNSETQHTIAYWGTLSAIFLLVGGTILQVVGFMLEAAITMARLTGATKLMTAAWTALKTAFTAFRVMGLAGGFQYLGLALGGIGLSAGAAVAGLTALGVAFYLILRSTNEADTAIGRMHIALQRFDDDAHTFSQNFSTIADTQQEINRSQLNLDASRRALADTKKGTDAYRQALQAVDEAQLQVTRSNEIMAKQMGKMRNSSRAMMLDVRGMLGGLADLQRQGAGTDPSTVHGAQAAAALGRLNQSFEGSSAEVQKKLQDFAPDFEAAIQEWNRAVAQGLNTQSRMAQATLGSLARIQGAYMGLNDEQKNVLASLTQLAGRPLKEFELQYIGGLKGIRRENALTFLSISHRLPSSSFLNQIGKMAPRIQGSVTALAAHIGRMPTKKQVNILTNIPREAMPAVENFIKRTGRIPSKKQVTIFVKVEQRRQNLEKQIQEQGRRMKMLRVPGFGVDTSAAQKKIDALRGKLRQLDQNVRKRRQATIFLKSKPADASGYGTQLGNDIKAGVLSGAGGLGAALGAQLSQDVDQAMQQARSHIGAKSPSVKFAKLVGEPIMEGIMKGVENKKKDMLEAMRSAMSDAIDNMQSMIQERKDTLKDQFGEMFSSDIIQQARDWGTKLTSADLFKDLTQRRSALLKFQRGIGRLRRRGISFGLAEELRQLGPESQDAIDALSHMTGRQLRRYSRLWGDTNGRINRMAVNQSKATLKHYRAQGANVALGFMRGMESMRPSLVRYFRKVFLDLYNQTKKTHKSHSPSKLYYNEGMNVAMGFRKGMEHGMRGAALAPVGVRISGRMSQSAQGGTRHTHYHIHQRPNESLMATLRRHDHVNRVRA